MKQVNFSLRQSNGTHATIELKNVNDSITQDAFCGMFLFPAILRLVKGANKSFDKALPVELHIEAINEDGEVNGKFLSQVTIKSSSPYAVRRAALAFNESIAALALPAGIHGIYELVDMKESKGAAFRGYSKSFLRPSVSLAKAMAN